MTPPKKKITLLGSTGSVGVNTLRIVKEYPQYFEIAGLAAGSQIEILKEQILEFSPQFVYAKESRLRDELHRAFGGRIKIFTQDEGLAAFAKEADSDILVAATTGTTALRPVLEALERGKRVALANKEILVVAGGLVLSKLKANPGASLIPVDSEHNAIFQCLEGNPKENVERLILTGSGGPLREVPKERFLGISKDLVTNHPKWKMGKKISVDSATLMNKGLEIIEASWLFGFPIEKIDVLIHPEAVIHSMVEFKDGALLAQLGVTDMKMPIQHALFYPKRVPCAPSRRLDFSQANKLTFSPPDRHKFPCLDIAYEAARLSGSAPCVMSAADEIAVGAFLEDKIDFIQIPRIIEDVLSRHRHVVDPDLSQIQSIHEWAIEETKKLCQAL